MKDEGHSRSGRDLLIASIVLLAVGVALTWGVHWSVENGTAAPAV